MSSIADFVAAAETARERVPREAFDVGAGELRVRVELIGEDVIATLKRGFLTYDDRQSDPAARIYAFESATSGVLPPAPPWPAESFKGPRQEIPGFTEPPRLAVYDIEHATLAYYDEDADAGVQWFRDGAEMAPGEGGAPLRNLLRWSLGAHGAHMLHLASAGGVLIGGPGGAGKSTTALNCALAGLDFTSDDFSVVTLGERPVAHAVYSCIKVTDAALELLPGLADFGEAAGLDWRGKHRIDLRSRITRSQEVHAIVLPELAPRTGTPEPLAPAEALRRLTGGSMTVMTGAMQRSLGALRELLERLPAYTLAVGPDLERIPEVVAQLGCARSAV